MLFTSESVTSGHPDKICDQISDAILDECLQQDPNSKVAVDTWIKDNHIGLIGELTTEARLDYQESVRKVLERIGYTEKGSDFSAYNFQLHNFIGKQSNEITQAVASQEDLGAGDQGLMFGCASSQTPELTPLPIALAHRLAQKLEEVRHTESGSPLKPDGKTQVTVEYDEKNVPQRIHTILVSTQHSTEIGLEELTELVKSKIIRQTLAEIGKESLLDDKTIFLVNPSGSFTQGGPVADSGMTGRKLVVDSYGGWNRIGGGAFSGKDPTKVDRSAAYMARYIAKWIVSQEWAKECELQLSYAIGQAAPVSLDLFGDFKKPVSEVKQEITKRFNLKPKGIIEFLNLQTPIYLPTAAYGHFGRLPEGDFFSWEQVKT